MTLVPNTMSENLSHPETAPERPRPTVPWWMRFVGVAALMATGCDLGSDPPPAPVRLDAFDGVDQVGRVFQPVPIPPAVRVLSAKGKPVKRVEVVFSVESGGGRVSGEVTETDGDGVARVGSWILGTGAGSQSLRVQVEGLPPLLVSATAEPANPAKATLVTGDGQSGVVGGPLGTQPAVKVRDLYGNPVPNTRVDFQVMEGGGFVARASSDTDEGGIASPGSWTLGRTPGLNRLLASVQGLSPVTFRATALPGPPERVNLLLGDGQTGRVGTALPLRPTLLIADRYGNLLANIPVTFRVLSGGGAVQNPDQVSDASGVVVSGPWVLGPAAGEQTLEITVSGLEPILLSATAEPGPPAALFGLVEETQVATVGTPVSVQPVVRVEDAFENPVPGVAVSFTEVRSPGSGESPGTLEGADAFTDEAGTARLQSWTLGVLAGTYGVQARVPGLEEGVEFLATGVPDGPAVLSVLEGDGQSAGVGSPVPLPLKVRVQDQHGNGVPAVEVVFTVMEGGGSIPDDLRITDGEGVAGLEEWILGPEPGRNLLRAMVEEVGSLTFEATALVAAPAGLAKVAGDGQTAEVGTAVGLPPEVRVTDASGHPVPGVAVFFAVTEGGGSLGQPVDTTDQSGTASPGSWILGTAVGVNRLSAQVEDLAPATFTAWAVSGPPASIQLLQGGGQRVLAGTYVPVPPTVRLADRFGNPTPGRSVTFSVLAGGGSVLDPTPSTDDDGMATVGRWILGPSPQVNRLSATTPGLSGVALEATGIPAGGLQIELAFLTPVSSSVVSVFEAAVARWEEIAPGDLPDFQGTLPEGGCQPEPVDGLIDDLRIYVSVETIDGVGGILGRAGPCYYRRSPVVSPVTGIMGFDEADLANLEASGLLEDVIVHEMGHVLGVGTLWNGGEEELLVGAGGADPHFTGPAARVAFDEVGGQERTAPKVPVENTGGGGTRDAHWRESVHNAELMTGWIEGGGTPNPLSVITIASLADLGYAVNMAAADPYILFNPLGVPGQVPSGPLLELREAAGPVPIPIDGGGAGR